MSAALQYPESFLPHQAEKEITNILPFNLNGGQVEKSATALELQQQAAIRALREELHQVYRQLEQSEVLVRNARLREQELRKELLGRKSK